MLHHGIFIEAKNTQKNNLHLHTQSRSVGIFFFFSLRIVYTLFRMDIEDTIGGGGWPLRAASTTRSRVHVLEAGGAIASVSSSPTDAQTLLQTPPSSLTTQLLLSPPPSPPAALSPLLDDVEWERVSQRVQCKWCCIFVQTAVSLQIGWTAMAASGAACSLTLIVMYGVLRCLLDWELADVMRTFV